MSGREDEKDNGVGGTMRKRSCSEPILFLTLSKLKFLAAGELRVAVFWPTSDCGGKTFVSPGEEALAGAATSIICCDKTRLFFFVFFFRDKSRLVVTKVGRDKIMFVATKPL